MTAAIGQSFQVLVAEHSEGCSMFGFALGIAARAHYLLRRFMPTNILLDALHTRRGLKWGAPAMLLAVPYMFAGVYCTGLVEAGGSGWLSALALLFMWNALKVLVAGPVALMRLLQVRGRETHPLRRATPRRRVAAALTRLFGVVASSRSRTTTPS